MIGKSKAEALRSLVRLLDKKNVKYDIDELNSLSKAEIRKMIRDMTGSKKREMYSHKSGISDMTVE